MKTKCYISFFLFAIGLLRVSISYAALLAGWDEFNASTAIYPKNADLTDGNISSASMPSPLLSGLNVGNSSNFQLTSWNTGGMVDLVEYWELSLSIQNGYLAQFSTLQLNIRMDETNLDLHIRSSQDSFANDIATIDLTNTFTVYTVDLSSLSNVSGDISFRIYATNAQTLTVFMFGQNSGSVTGGGFVAFNGAVTTVPEPNAWALSGAGILLSLCWIYRSKNSRPRA